ncbi:MAG: FkbM family methyltransferase [Deltaproteobacteria bacterium]|nr:FkbM family methyltransferase [Deltaproteobacteria bacterium]
MSSPTIRRSLALLAGGALVVCIVIYGYAQREPGAGQVPVAPSAEVQQVAPAVVRSPVEVERPSEILLSGKNLYSQNQEELIIRDFFQDKRGGFFLDVGAAWPIHNSTTYYLEKHLGWWGLAVDALPDYGPAWQEKRPRSKFISYAVTDHSGDSMTFYRHDWTEVSSLSKKHAARFGGEETLTAIEVQTITLTDLLDRNAITKIDHLTIDIEGAELMALAGFDIRRFKPDLVCIEAHNRGKKGEQEIRQYFEDNGYAFLEEYAPYERANWYFAPKAETALPH